LPLRFDDRAAETVQIPGHRLGMRCSSEEKSFADTFSASTASVASEMSFGILIVVYALAFCEFPQISTLMDCLCRASGTTCKVSRGRACSQPSPWAGINVEPIPQWTMQPGGTEGMFCRELHA
jgi:hypothetical protein